MEYVYLLRCKGRIRAFSDKAIMGEFVKRHLNMSIARGLDSTYGKGFAGFSYKRVLVDGDMEYPNWTAVDKNFFSPLSEDIL